MAKKTNRISILGMEYKEVRRLIQTLSMQIEIGALKAIELKFLKNPKTPKSITRCLYKYEINHQNQIDEISDVRGIPVKYIPGQPPSLSVIWVENHKGIKMQISVAEINFKHGIVLHR